MGQYEVSRALAAIPLEVREMFCPECGTQCVENFHGDEATCFTCPKCPSHWVRSLELGPWGPETYYLPSAEKECPCCGVVVPHLVDGFYEGAFNISR